MTQIRVGFGYDAHRFGGPGPVVLCGVPIEHSTGLEGTSDADAAAHAVADALLGAAGIGDIGKYFPSDAPQWLDADSLDMATQCAVKVNDRGFEIANIDLTVIAQSVRISPHREQMRERLAAACRVEVGLVSVKATTTDGLGWIGADEGLAVHAVVALTR
ncbi:MAG: 2-C-methyl-D-erythritol 2,4-cyclodiphosphate synthase [Acidimicrobiia bacterium]